MDQKHRWLDDHIFGRLRATDDLQRRQQQVIAHRAADTAIRQANRFALNVHHQLRININCAEIIDQDGHTQTMIGMQDTVEQRRFACTEKAGQDGQRNGCRR